MGGGGSEASRVPSVPLMDRTLAHFTPGIEEKEEGEGSKLKKKRKILFLKIESRDLQKVFRIYRSNLI